MAKHQITDLPLNGRSFAELARLTPGVVMLSGTGNAAAFRKEVDAPANFRKLLK